MARQFPRSEDSAKRLSCIALRLATRTTSPTSRFHSPLTMGVPLWTREQVACRILAGDALFIRHNKVVRVPPSWLDAHPGGSLAIQHFVGRDATDEVSAFHSEETMRKMKGYEIAEVEAGEHGWEPLLPPVMSGWVRKRAQDGTMRWHREATTLKPLPEEYSEITPSSQVLLIRQKELQAQHGPSRSSLEPGPSSLSLEKEAEHSQAYKELHQRVADAGLYQTRYIGGYGPEVLRYVTFIVISVLAYRREWFLTSAFFLGLFWHQVTFTVHDLGHLGVTHKWAVDRLIAIVIADFMGGLSVGWWVDVSPRPFVALATQLIYFCSRTTILIIVSFIAEGLPKLY